jgi:hypothetical protein
MKPVRTFTYNNRGRGRNISTFVLTDAEIDRVSPVLSRLNTASDMIRYLYDEGWSNSAIAKVVRYPTDTLYHKAGDPLLAAHVSTTVIKYRDEKMANPMAMPIRNAQLPPGLVRLPPSEGVVVDVNPDREPVEQIAAGEVTEEELDRETSEEETPAGKVGQTTEPEAAQPPTDVNVTGSQWEGELRKAVANNYKDVPTKE